MDFLKSAVASAMAKGPPFPYNFGDKVDLDESIWTLYNGTKRVMLCDPAQTSRKASAKLNSARIYRKMAPTAASCPSKSTTTQNLACPWPRMP